MDQNVYSNATIAGLSRQQVFVKVNAEDGGQGQNFAEQMRVKGFPTTVILDGKGRVYITDFKGIQVFDGNGRYMTVFDPGGTASGMVFNDRNELFVAARKHVLKLALNEP